MVLTTNGDPANADDAQGIRLPPISFLSGAQNSQSLASMVLSVGSLNAEANKTKNGQMSFPGSTQKMSLPKPQALNIYPGQNLVSPHGMESGVIKNGGNNVADNRLVHKLEDQIKSDYAQVPSSGTRPLPHRHYSHSPSPDYPHNPTSIHAPKQSVDYSSHQSDYHRHRYMEPYAQHFHQQNADIQQRHAITNEGQLGFRAAEIHSPNSPINSGHFSSQLADRASQRKRQKRLMHSHIYDQLPRVLPSRRNLGTIVYNPTTTWETLQIKQLHGLRKQDLDMLVRMQSEYMERKNDSAGEMSTVYIPVIPHLSDAYINCFLEVKIPYVHIKDFLKSHSQGQVERKRELWGGYAGIYTDDSDLLYVLCHLGLFNNSLDLTECNAEWVPSDVTRPATVHRDQDGIELLDLSVTLLLLPSLNAYKGFYRNGLNSRSWLSSAAVHSGLSIAVHNVKWETFLLSTADRALNKRAASEYIDDRNASTQILAQKNGWKLDLLLRKSKHDVKAQAPGAS